MRLCKNVVALLLKWIFCFSRQMIRKWLLTKIGGGQPSAVPLHCCMRIFSGWNCMTLPLSPVFSHLNFILVAEVPTTELTCPSLFSRAVMVAWSGPLLLVLKIHDLRTLCIDQPTSIPISDGQRMTPKSLFRKSWKHCYFRLGVHPIWSDCAVDWLQQIRKTRCSKW